MAHKPAGGAFRTAYPISCVVLMDLIIAPERAPRSFVPIDG
jgi:hypothetical protein